jgi:glutamine amidotransferase
MCELLAMSAQRPVEVGPWLERLRPRGGLTGPHADGWGVACYEGPAARVFKDAAPAAQSLLLQLLARHPLRTTAMIAHIRLANPSIFGRETGNTHPFEREWGGRSWVFAHNGKLPGVHDAKRLRSSRFRPVGGTDSEVAFCCILDAIARRAGRKRPLCPASVLDTIEPVAEELAAYGEFNFILSDGECLYVHAHTRLHALERTGSSSDGAAKMTLLATAPLTGEPWQALAPRSLHVYRAGELILGGRDRFPQDLAFASDEALVAASRHTARAATRTALRRAG